MERKNNPTFYKNGFRRIKCPYCKKIVGKKGKAVLTTSLKTSTQRAYECCHCKKIFIVYPPLKTTDKNGLKIIKWGPDLSHTTADLTDKDIEPTIPA